jgi:guanylate kinase
MTEQGMLIVVSGPSGVGKDTIVRLFLETTADCVLSVSATTRSPRQGEQEGIDYFFVDHSAFEALIANGEMLEHAKYGNNYYGTPKKAIDTLLAQGKNVILVIEVNGAMLIRKMRPDAVLVFLIPPTWETLEQRLQGRGTETPEQVQTRLQAARGELAEADKYDYIVVNNTIEQCVHDFSVVMEAAKHSARRMYHYLKEAFPQC